MGFTEAIASGFRNYVTFSGRAVRSEYWFWTLFMIIAMVAGALIDFALFPNLDISPFYSIVSLGLFLPGLAVSIRRLHMVTGPAGGICWSLPALEPLCSSSGIACGERSALTGSGRTHWAALPPPHPRAKVACSN